MTQAVSTPNGLIAHLFGPVEGRHHDAYMLSASGLISKLQAHTQSNGQPYIPYGDPAYGVLSRVLSPFRAGQVLTPAEQEFNRSTSAVRVTVEWSFGKIVQLFAYLDFKKTEASFAASGQILYNWCSPHQLSHLPVWITDFELLWFDSTIS